MNEIEMKEMSQAVRKKSEEGKGRRRPGNTPS